MGTWGTGIYSNDVAEDVRVMCQEIYPFVEPEEGNRIIFESFKDFMSSPLADNDGASFWYALSDWQWKHGILSDEIRLKALELLNQNAGLSEWEESGSGSDVKKRIQVMKRLKQQLESPMPALKIPKSKRCKPAHKSGDVIIFRTCSRKNDPNGFFWNITCFHDHYLFRERAISEGEEFLDPPFAAHEKYMAILCVGTIKSLRSQYLPDVYDEHSVYAYYDYLSEIKPTLQVLKRAGFLPSLNYHLKDFNKHTHDSIGWTYLFSIDGRIVKEKTAITEIEKQRCLDEKKRFYKLLEQKRYLPEVDAHLYDLAQVFGSFVSTRVRMKRLGRDIDNLLSAEAVNPQLLAPMEADIAYRKWCDSLHDRK